MRTSFFLLLFLRFVLLEFSIHILQRSLKLNKLPLNQGLLKLEPVRLLDDKLLLQGQLFLLPGKAGNRETQNHQ